MRKVITFGEIMLRLSPPGNLRFSQANNFDVVYGGGESNVAVTLANFGIPVDFVSRLPDNDIGMCALMEMRKRNVGVDKIIFGGDRLGIYFLETGAVSRASKVIYDRENSSISQIKKGMIDWEKVFKGANWFHWTGITPAISQNAADVCLEAIKFAEKEGLTISTDLNYRSKLWNYGVSSKKIMTKLTSYCDVILGNEEDAEKHLISYSISEAKHFGISVDDPNGLQIGLRVKYEEGYCDVSTESIGNDIIINGYGANAQYNSTCYNNTNGLYIVSKNELGIPGNLPPPHGRMYLDNKVTSTSPHIKYKLTRGLRGKELDSIQDYIRKNIIHKSKLIIVGHYAFNYYVKKVRKVKYEI